MLLKIFFFFILSGVSLGEIRLNLDISIIHKKGMDNNLVLKNEIHTKKVFFDEEKSLKIDLKNGFRIYFRVKKVAEKDILGPSDQFKVGIQIVDKNGDLLKSFAKDPIDTKLNIKSFYSYKNSEGELIDITLEPNIFTL